MIEPAKPLKTRWGKEVSPWRDVPQSDWRNLRWQLQHLVRTVDQLADLLDLLDTEKLALRRLQKRFRILWLSAPIKLRQD